VRHVLRLLMQPCWHWLLLRLQNLIRHIVGVVCCAGGCILAAANCF
jgi:hypothetical protein